MNFIVVLEPSRQQSDYGLSIRQDRPPSMIAFEGFDECLRDAVGFWRADWRETKLRGPRPLRCRACPWRCKPSRCRTTDSTECAALLIQLDELDASDHQVAHHLRGERDPRRALCRPRKRRVAPGTATRRSGACAQGDPRARVGWQDCTRLLNVWRRIPLHGRELPHDYELVRDTRSYSAREDHALLNDVSSRSRCRKSASLVTKCGPGPMQAARSTLS